jgi:hypothetical protein
VTESFWVDVSMVVYVDVVVPGMMGRWRKAKDVEGFVGAEAVF